MSFAECEKHLGEIILNVAELEKIITGKTEETVRIEKIKGSLVFLEIMLSSIRNKDSKQ
jgi:hypothetical protein